MRKKNYSVKNIQRAYNINAQGGIVILIFLIFMSFITGLIVVDTFFNYNFVIMIFMLIFCAFCSLIVILNFNIIIKTFRNRRKMFEEKVSMEMRSVLDEELQDTRSCYFENFCIGQQYLINLNPEPYDSIFLEKKKVRFFSVKKVKLGIKYTYWANQFSIQDKNGRKLTVNIVDKLTANKLKHFFLDECNISFEEN